MFEATAFGAVYDIAIETWKGTRLEQKFHTWVIGRGPGGEGAERASGQGQGAGGELAALCCGDSDLEKGRAVLEPQVSPGSCRPAAEPHTPPTCPASVQKQASSARNRKACAEFRGNVKDAGLVSPQNKTPQRLSGETGLPQAAKRHQGPSDILFRPEKDSG